MVVATVVAVTKVTECQSPAPPVHARPPEPLGGRPGTQWCSHCDRPIAGAEHPGRTCSEECSFCCGSRCVHVRALISRLVDVALAAASLSRQVGHVLFEHGDDYEVLHEGMRQSAEALDEKLRELEAPSPATTTERVDR